MAVGETGKGHPSIQIDDLRVRGDRGANLSQVARSADPLTADGDRPYGTVAVSSKGSVYEKAIRRQSTIS